MAHVRHDNLTAPIEWWKHLRPEGKRTQNRMERAAAKHLINSMLADLEKGTAYRPLNDRHAHYSPCQSSPGPQSHVHLQ